MKEEENIRKDTVGIFEAFKLLEMHEHARFKFIKDMFNVTIIQEDLKYIRVEGSDGNPKMEWNLDWVASVVNARVAIMPVKISLYAG